MDSDYLYGNFLQRPPASAVLAWLKRIGHRRFLSVTLRLTEDLRRLPLLNEIRERLLAEGLNIRSDEIGRLAPANDLGWLKRGLRGKPAVLT